MAKTRAASGQGSSSPSGALVQTTATALGSDTFADTTVAVSVKEHGRVTITRGEVTTTAFAATDGGTPYTTTGIGVAPINGDVFHTKTKVVTGNGTTFEATWSFESTTTKIFVLDNPGRGHKGGGSDARPVHKSVVEQPPLEVDGNAAFLRLDLTASGDNSLVSAEAMVLAMDNYSDVNTMIFLGTDHLFP